MLLASPPRYPKLEGLRLIDILGHRQEGRYPGLQKTSSLIGQPHSRPFRTSMKISRRDSRDAVGARTA